MAGGGVSSRARAVAVQEGEIGGDRGTQRVTAWLRMHAALGPLHEQVQTSNSPPAVEINDALYWLAVLLGLWGMEITEALEATITKREMGLVRKVPGSLAPIPDAAGTFRDPATGKSAEFDR